MKPVVRVAQLELNILFYSPIAWFLLAVLLVQCGIIFPDVLGAFVRSSMMHQSLDALTNYIFNWRGSGIFRVVGGSLYLYLPLLTMGLISRETSSGTIKLLYSSPIKVREIIFGKFAAMMVFNLLLIGVVGIFVVFSIFTIESPDIGQLFSGLLGMYLLLCAYAAIGLFMSCLTSYQVVAAISTLVVFSILSYIGMVWQDTGFVRDLTYFLSIAGRASKMYGGLITTKDALYFVTIMYIFLGFGICKLLAGRESRSLLVRSGRYALVFVSALLIGYVTSRPRFTGYYDATANKTNTLTVNARRIIKEFGGEPLEVTSYINLLDNYYFDGAPERRNADMTRWEPFVRFKPDIRFKYVYYYDSVPNPAFYERYPGMSLRQIAQKMAGILHINLADFKSPAEIHQMIDLRPESNRYVMQLKYKGRSTFLRLFDDSQVFPGERETSAALKRLLGAKPPKILFVQGNLERSLYKMGDRDYGMLTSRKQYRWSLVNQGFDVDTISLKTREIPSDITALVVADPRMDLDTVTMGKVLRYIEGGGNLLIAGEPGKQAVLNPLLAPLGVQLMEGTLVQQSQNIAANLVLAGITSAAAGLSTEMKWVVENEEPISMPSAAALSYTGNGPFTTRPLLLSDRSGWITKERLVLDSADIRYAAENGDVRGAFPVSLCLTRPVGVKEQRIVVTGDADFMSNVELNRKNVVTGNENFDASLFGWFTHGAFPIDTSRPPSRDNHLWLTGKVMVYVRLVFRWLLPGLFVAFGTILLLRRQRK